MRQLVDASLSEHNYDLRMSFPSAMARPLFVRYGAGTVVGALPSWIRRHSLTRPVPALAAPLARTALAAASFAADRPRPRVTVEALEELGAEVDELAEASASFARCIRIRDSAYLRWRWLAQPDAHWEIRAARAEGGCLIGFSVLGLRRGCTVEPGGSTTSSRPIAQRCERCSSMGSRGSSLGEPAPSLPLPRPATVGSTGPRALRLRAHGPRAAVRRASPVTGGR